MDGQGWAVLRGLVWGTQKKTETFGGVGYPVRSAACKLSREPLLGVEAVGKQKRLRTLHRWFPFRKPLLLSGGPLLWLYMFGVRGPRLRRAMLDVLLFFCV